MDFYCSRGRLYALSTGLHAKTCQVPFGQREEAMDLVYVGILALFVLLAWGLLALCDRV
jgi:hypothetical protein